MKRQKTIIFILICLGLFAGSTAWALEVDYPEVGGTTLNDQSTLTDYLNYVYVFALGIVGIAAVGVLVYAGFLRMLSGTITSKEESTKWIWGAITGIVLALCAYLILYIINPDLVRLSLPSLAGGPPPGGNPPPPPPTSPPSVPNPNQAEEEALRLLLAGHGIDVYAPPCAENCGVTMSCIRCVNLVGMQESTLLGLYALREACPVCRLLITGGTEAGHSSGEHSHANGYKVDLDTTPSLDYFMNSHDLDGDGLIPVGNYVLDYLYEANPEHWDIRILPA